MTHSSKKDSHATSDPAENSDRRRHDFREARTTLDYIVKQIEAGYDFKDDFGPHLINELRKISRFLEHEYQTLTRDKEL